MINSGYYWLQVAVPLIGFRFLVELIWPDARKGQQLKKLGVLLSIISLAVLLSWPRLGGISEFQLSKFPRQKGEVSHFQVIGDTKSLLGKLIPSFFDARLITHTVHSGMLGFMWDYNNFIGLLALIPLLLGLWKTKQLFHLKIFIGLLLAVCFQLALMRTTHVADLIRHVIPLYKSVTWYWRGTPILVLLAVTFIAIGYETMLRDITKKGLVLLAGILMVLNLGEILWANHRYFTFPDPPLADIGRPSFIVSKPLQNHFFCRIDYIFGYGNTFPPQLSINHRVNVWDYFQNPDYYNMHDVRALFDPKTPRAYYLEHPWPLWPKTNSKEFEEFINFKQVVKPSPQLQLLNKLSLTAAGAYLTCLLVFLCARLFRGFQA